MKKYKFAILGKHTLIYGLSSVVGRFLNYLLVPLYTYKIAVESGGYGVVTNLYGYTAIIMAFLIFGMETTSQYFANKEGVNRDRAFSTSTLFVGILSMVFLTLVIIFLKPIAKALDYAENPEYIMIMAIIVVLDAVQAVMFTRLRFENKAVKFAILKLVFVILNIGLNLFIFIAAPVMKENHPFLMSWYNESYQVGYIFVVNLICTSLVTFGFIPEICKLRFGIDKTLLVKMLQYSWPIMLMGLVGNLNISGDKICYRFIMPGEEGEVQLGIYGACVKIAAIMAMFTQAFRYAYEPYVFGGKRDKESKEEQSTVMKYYIIGTLLAFLVMVAYLPIIKYVINADYWGGLRAVPIVMMADIFFGIYFNLSFWYKLIEKTWWGAIFSGIGCVALLSINFIFIPKYGYMACAWGSFVGSAICMVLSYIIGQKKNPIQYDLKSAFTYFAVAMVLYLVQRIVNINDVVWTLVVNTCLLLVFVVFIFWREKELSRIVMARIRKVIRG